MVANNLNIKPVDGLQNISGLDPVGRHEKDKKRKQQERKGGSGHEESFHEEEVELNEEVEEVFKDDEQGSKIDFSA